MIPHALLFLHFPALSIAWKASNDLVLQEKAFIELKVCVYPIFYKFFLNCLSMYSFLFYKVYRAVQKSGNNVGLEVFITSVFMALIIIINICSLFFLLQGFELLIFDFNLIRPYLVLIAITILTLVFVFFKFIIDYNNIIKRYDEKSNFLSKIPSWIIFFLYVFLSTVFMILSAMFKNHDGLFQ